jgi:hypothetical protein
MIRLAISFFGGHGVMEDFLSLPRLHRDAMIMELWEGPRSVLLTQIHRDFQRVANWYSPEEFVHDLLEGANNDKIKEYAFKFKEIIDAKSLLKNDSETLTICNEWQKFSNKLFIAYQEQALDELNAEFKIIQFSKLLRKFKRK